MRTINRLILISTSIFFLSSCNIMRDDYKVVNDIHKNISENEIDKKIKQEQLHKDIDFLVRTIEDVHVDPYLNIDKQSFYKAISELKESINKPITRKEFYQKITPIVHLLKDSHTTVRFPFEIRKQYEANNGLYFPVEITTDKDKRLLVKNNHSDYKFKSEDEIVSINGISAQIIIDSLVGYEYGSVINSNIRRMVGRFHNHLWQDLNFISPYQVQLVDTIIMINGLPKNELNKIKKESLISKSKAIQYKLLLDSVGYLLVPSFNVQEKIFNNKLKEVFTQLNKDKPANLIIDVQNNTGGNESNGFSLLSYIAKEPFHMYSKFLRKKSKQYDKRFKQRFKWWIRWLINIKAATKMDDHMKTYFSSYIKKNYGEIDTLDNKTLSLHKPREDSLKYNGNLFVLQNEYSYSATVGFLGAIKDYGIGIIIGSESGESPNGFGEGYLFELPNSRLICQSSTTLMIRPNGNTEMTRGIKPDFEIDISKCKNSEEVLENIIELINKE